MNQEQLLNLAYQYYPKNITFRDREINNYLNTDEYKRLSQKIKEFTFQKKYIDFHQSLIEKLSNHEKLNNLRETSLLGWEDRCLIFEFDFIENEVLIKINLQVSVITELYVLFITTNKISIHPYKWLSLPQRDKSIEQQQKYASILEFINQTMKDDFGYTALKEEQAHIILEDVCFQDIAMGQFNLYHAFFLNDNKFVS